jgi:tetratricopeptide (TPR) repeat protein
LENATWKRSKHGRLRLKFENDNPDLHANMAALLYRKGDFEGAIRSYMNAHRLLPSDPTILAAWALPSRNAKCTNQALRRWSNPLPSTRGRQCRIPTSGLAYYLFNR